MFKIDKSKLYRRKRKRKIYEYYYNGKKIGYIYYIRPLFINGIMWRGKCWDVIAWDFDVKYDGELPSIKEAENILLNQFEEHIDTILKRLYDLKIIKESDILWVAKK